MVSRCRRALLLVVLAACGGEIQPPADARGTDGPGHDASDPDRDAAAGDAPIEIDGGPPGDGAPGDAALGDGPVVIDAPPIDAPGTPIDAPPIDAPGTPIDAPGTPIDAPGTPIDAPGGMIDAPTSACGGDVLNLSAAEACAVSYTGTVTPCSVTNNVPSTNGHLEIERPDGARGYVCAFNWTSTGGYYFGDRRVLKSTSSGCCGGSPGSALSWPASSADYGIPHAPTRVGRQETATDNGGEIRHNPFTIVVSNAAAASAYQSARASWLAWAGDGQPHTGPDGNAYYFPDFLVINYIVVPTTLGKPLILIAPEVMLDAALTRPLGHPTLGACTSGGGGPLAYIGGDIQGRRLTNGSGRFGFEATVTRDDLVAAAALFNCYGIPIDDIIFTQP